MMRTAYTIDRLTVMAPCTREGTTSKWQKDQRDRGVARSRLLVAMRFAAAGGTAELLISDLSTVKCQVLLFVLVCGTCGSGRRRAAAAAPPLRDGGPARANQLTISSAYALD